MLLYHGSNIEVPSPKIIEPARALDFGAGFDGILNAKETIERLLPEKLKDQYAFATEKSLRCLSFIEASVI